MRLRSLLAILCLSLGLWAGTPGSIRYGAVPPGAGARPVLLFVHGWNSDSSTWSGSNDMAAKATAGGYRTAFLDSYADRSMWDNGPLIAAAVDQVKAHFSGAGVVLVCHSKGGVDGQTALVYCGASTKVERLITLSAPHRGTPLADLAWSAWAGWLADLVGAKNEGNRVLQTGYMASFRAQTDAKAESRVVPLYTAGGTKAGPWFSAYWFGGMAIGRTSDGVVPLDATDLPYQRARLFTRNWNHDEVKQGSNAWPYLQACLAAPALAAATATLLAEAVPDQGHGLDRLYRGGATVSGMAEFTFPVDAGQRTVQVLLQTAAAPRRVLLVSPSGHIHALASLDGRFRREDLEDEASSQAFPGAINHQLNLTNPEPGLWRVQLSAQGEDAYFFTALFPGDGAKRISSAEARALVHGGSVVSIAATGGPQIRDHAVHTPAPAGSLRAVKVQPMAEPSVVNHTLVFTWPNGRERAVIFSEAE
jgi:pimeloyl-ACP methyl ester carboxylesterase